MDHADLVAEFPVIEKLTPQERIQLARERRSIQLIKNRERERAQGDPPSKTDKVKFKPGIALLEATARNDIDEVRKLLGEGANPNSHNEDGLTPLHQCAIDNNEEILLVLLEEGADVNAQDTELWTPLHAAACCTHINVVRHLIDRGANLLAVNADGNMPYDICDDDETLDVIESEMARRGITQEDIDEERGSGERRMLADMKWLHQHGSSLSYTDLDGATPLHVAACNGYYDVAAFLLRCGVDPNIRDDDSWMPIHAAACWAQPDLIELLAECGGDINAKTENDETALDLCEEDTTRHVILTLRAEAARRRRMAFPRDSRRQSKKRKSISKFESPQTPAGALPNDHSPFSARGAIRRLSHREKGGPGSLARIEAQKEGAALLRSFSLEDTSTAAFENGESGKNGSKDASELSQDNTSDKKSSGQTGVSSVVTSNSSTSGSRRKKKKKDKDKPDKDEDKRFGGVSGGSVMSEEEWRQKLDEEGGGGKEDQPKPPKRGAKPPSSSSSGGGSNLKSSSSPSSSSPHHHGGAGGGGENNDNNESNVVGGGSGKGLNGSAEPLQKLKQSQGGNVGGGGGGESAGGSPTHRMTSSNRRTKRFACCTIL